MSEVFFDAIEREQLCDLLDDLGPLAPTLLGAWTTHDLAAHLVLREHRLLAAPGLVVPGAWARVAERQRIALREEPFAALVAKVRSGPPPGFFRIRWVRRVPNLNEYFVHHEDVRRARGLEPRPISSKSCSGRPSGCDCPPVMSAGSSRTRPSRFVVDIPTE